MSHQIETATTVEEATVTLQYFSLSEISGVYRAIELLYAELSVPPFGALGKNSLSQTQINSLLASYPIKVVRYRKQFFCSGGVRQYQLACRELPPASRIPCLIEFPSSDAEIEDRAISELLFAPAALGIRFSETRLLAAIATRANAKGRLPTKPRVDDRYLAKLYGVDRRQLSGRVSSFAEESIEEQK